MNNMLFSNVRASVTHTATCDISSILLFATDTTPLSLNRLGIQKSPPRTSNIPVLRRLFSAILVKKNRIPFYSSSVEPHFLIFKSRTLQQMLWISIFASELLVEQCCIACTSLFKQVSKFLCHLWIQDIARFCKGCKRICV